MTRSTHRLALFAAALFPLANIQVHHWQEKHGCSRARTRAPNPRRKTHATRNFWLTWKIQAVFRTFMLQTSCTLREMLRVPRQDMQIAPRLQVHFLLGCKRLQVNVVCALPHKSNNQHGSQRSTFATENPHHMRLRPPAELDSQVLLTFLAPPSNAATIDCRWCPPS